MDPFVDETYEENKNLGAAAVIEARMAAEAGGGEVPRTVASDAALQELKERLELLRASCKRAEGGIDEAKRRAECGLFSPNAAAAAIEEEAEGGAPLGDGVGEMNAPIVVDEEVVEVAAAMEEEAEGGAALGDGVGEDAIVGEMDGPIAARENVVWHSVDIHFLRKIPDAPIVVDEEVAAAMEEEADGGDGVGEMDAPIAARENVVWHDVDIHHPMKIPDAPIVAEGGTALGDVVGEDAIVEAVEGKESAAARENAEWYDADLTEILDACTVQESTDA